MYDKATWHDKLVLLYGHSLGGEITIDLAVQHPEIADVIVEGSFTSVRAMLDYMSQYRLFRVDWILTQRCDSLAKVQIALSRLSCSFTPLPTKHFLLR